MSTAKDVVSDYKKFIDAIKLYSSKKVEETISDISTITNNKYDGDRVDQNVQLAGKATTFKLVDNKTYIDGYVTATDAKELIYLEFGTRLNNNSSLIIETGFKSGIQTINIAAPYKVNTPFFNDRQIIGRYYFLDTIDTEGLNFLRTFGK